MKGKVMQVDLETLRTQIFKVGIYRIAGALDASAEAEVLADQLASFSGKYWYVWVNHGDGTFHASVQSSDELSLLAAQGKQIDLQSGPLECREQAQQYMDAAVAQDRCSRAADEPCALPPKGKVVWGSGGDGDHDYRPDDSINVVDVFWGEPGDQNHTQRYHVGMSPGKQLWVLWQQYVNGISGQSPRPWVIAHMTQHGVTQKLAAKRLLAFALKEERNENMRQFDGIAVVGCMSAAEVARVASKVWKGG